MNTAFHACTWGQILRKITPDFVTDPDEHEQLNTVTVSSVVLSEYDLCTHSGLKGEKQDHMNNE